MTPSLAALARPPALARVGQCLALLGRRAEAISTLTEAIPLLEQAQWFSVQARSLEILANELTHEGRTDEGRRVFGQAAELFASVGDPEASSRCHNLATGSP